MADALGTSALVLALTVISIAVTPPTPDAPGRPEAFGHDDVFTFIDQVALADSQAGVTDPAASPWHYERFAGCGLEPLGIADELLLVTCAGFPLECADGAAPLAPLWRRELEPTNAAGWERVGDWICPELAVPAFTARELRDLLIVSGSVDLEPAAGPLLVNMANVVHTDAAVQTFTPTLLGFTFEVEVTPTSYTWDFADGTGPLRTTDPGAPYRTSSGDDLRSYLTHTYAQAGTHAITLTTTWSGRYRVLGRTDWQDVIGTATTTATSRTFDVVERRAHLVAEDCF
ncbi:MAG: PKD domain-containing protein, partial [Cellulomonadaceae bacterium]|nr:PKD domain-containing protein [Cellulomonadaceae bacterium]